MLENPMSSKRNVIVGVVAGFVAGVAVGYLLFASPASCYPGRACKYVNNVCKYTQPYAGKQAGELCP